MCIRAITSYNDEYIFKKYSVIYPILFLYFGLLCTIQGKSEEPCYIYIDKEDITCEIDPKVKYANAASRIQNGKQPKN